MTSLLAVTVLGFFLGMRHAADPDHVIAVTTIVSRHGSPARAVVGFTDASRWKPLLIARTWVVLPVLDGSVTSDAVICWKPPVARRTTMSARPSTIAAFGGSVAIGSFEVRRTTSVTPVTGFHHESVASTVQVKA